MPFVSNLGFASAKGYGFGSLVDSGIPIGTSMEGGYLAGLWSSSANGIADYYIIASPKSSGQSGPVAWKTSATTSPGTESFTDGAANTAAMNDVNHPAAQFCTGLTIGGFSDWYMPAFWESEISYYNLKPSTTSNTILSNNPYAVPTRTGNYTTTVPSQTTATDFQSPSGTNFYITTTNHWTSTQFPSNTIRAYTMNFNTGLRGNYSKTSGSSYRVRAIRKVLIT